MSTVAVLNIRPATVADAGLILHFIRELAIYEKAEHSVQTDEIGIAESLFGPDATARALICEADGEAIGYAVYFYNYSTWLGRKGIYLEDLYVSQEKRGAGAGKALLKYIARQAVAEAHEIGVYDMVFLRPGGIPRTSSGKIQRHACRTAYLDGVDDGATPANAAETLFVTARDNGWLVTQSAARGVYLSPAAPGANGAMVDFTSAAAMDMWVSRLRPLVAMGVRAFKLDYYEDIFPEVFGVRPDFHFSDGRTERELHGVFNTLFHTAYRRALDEGAGADGGFLFVRGSAWGGQTIADLIWPGDLDNDLREAGTTEVGGLPAAISAAQTLASSGFPTFSPDTGGYRGGMPTRESLLRWAELTTFLPIQQLGGDGAHHNPWLYDAEAGALWHRLTRIHMDLVPYLRMNALRASRTGYPPVSAPALAFPEDAGSVADPYAYMLGPDIFVAPTWQPGATTRAVHLPPGEWVHWFTGVRTTGPADLTVDAPLGQTPAFVRVGAIVPMLPEDLDTLVDADAPVVDPADRPYLRAWILPAGDRTIETEEGIGLRVARTATDVTLEVTPTAAGLDDLRMRIALDGASPAIATVTSVTDGSTAVTMAATADSVRAGCDGVCWFRDGTTLWLSARRRTASTIVVR